MEQAKLDWDYLNKISKRLAVVEKQLETLDWALKKEHERIGNIEEYLEKNT